jgi:uncharacterized protein (DUF433 family)
MVRSKLSDTELIELYVDAGPTAGGAAEARLRRSWVPVWAVIGQTQTVGDDPEMLADAYDIPVEEAEAALAYYRRHRDIIDARLDANRVV